MRRLIFPLAACVLAVFTPHATGADEFDALPRGKYSYRGQGLVVSVSPRTSDQLLAFYTARGFPYDAAQQIAQRCFLTVGIRNERADVVWLELDNWRFFDDKARAHVRFTRRDWHDLWDRLKLEPAKRATFGWTQLPESRDLRPGEPVGGNVTLPRPTTPFTLEAKFHTRADKTGPVLVVRFDNLTCPVNGAS